MISFGRAFQYWQDLRNLAFDRTPADPLDRTAVSAPRDALLFIVARIDNHGFYAAFAKHTH